MRIERVVAVYIVNKSGQVLMLWHKKARAWLPAGGRVQENEFVHEAAIREVEEETGLEIEFVYDDLGLVYKYDGPNKRLDQRAVLLPSPFLIQMEDLGSYYHEDYVYLTRTENDMFDNKENHDMDWFTFDEAVELDTFEHVKQHLIYIRKRLNL